jgi:hypothetical protein
VDRPSGHWYFQMNNRGRWYWTYQVDETSAPLLRSITDFGNLSDCKDNASVNGYRPQWLHKEYVTSDRWEFYRDLQSLWRWCCYKTIYKGKEICLRSPKGFRTREECIVNAARYGYSLPGGNAAPGQLKIGSRSPCIRSRISPAFSSAAQKITQFTLP